jgi:hypothetical protein
LNFERGDIAAAMQPMPRCVELFSALGSEQVRNRSAAILTMAEIARDSDEYESAAPLYRRVLVDLREIAATSSDDAAWLNVVCAKALYGLGGCQICTGDTAGAVASLAACESMFEAGYANAPELLAQVRRDLAEARTLMG